MRVVALLALCFAAVAAVPANPERIVGGSVTNIQQYPSMVALLYSASGANHRQSCGGTILNARAILTAAHCTNGHPVNRWRARVGSTNANSGGVVHTISTMRSHPDYNRAAIWDADIAVIRTASNIAYNNAVQPGRIAGSSYNLGDNQVVWATGWGRIVEEGASSEQLRHVQVWTINQNVCAQSYQNTIYRITANMLCSGVLNQGGRDQCTGDSGGPLYHNGVVVGVCSFGQGCARPNFPGVNARVSRFTTWISSNS